MPDFPSLRESLRGVHNFLPTPFLPDYKPDLHGMRENVAYHAKNFSAAMIVTVCGGFGEGLALDAEEHKDIVAAAVDGAASNLPVSAVVWGGYGMQRKMALKALQRTRLGRIRPMPCLFTKSVPPPRPTTAWSTRRPRGRGRKCTRPGRPSPRSGLPGATADPFRTVSPSD